ncbi:BamA/TamA family outer membrane protein [Chitinophaga lutea]
MRKVISVISLCALGMPCLQAQDSTLISPDEHEQFPVKYDSSGRRRSSLFPLPVLGYSPEKGFEFGAATLYSYYADKKRPSMLTRNSTMSVLATFTTNSQFKLDLRSENWTRNNDYHIKTNLRYHNFPVYFFGLGDTTHYDDRSLVGNKRYKASIEAEKRITSHFYAGFSVLYQHDRFTADDEKGIYQTADLVDKDGGYATFLGVTGVYDNRDNQNYCTGGTYVRFNASYAPSFLSKHPLWRFELKAAQFIHVSPKSVIGVNGLAQSLQGSTLPYYLLPEMGSDNIMRGYYTGRYRDQNYLAAQAEYRYFLDPKMRIRIWFMDTQPTFALAGFVGTGTVFENGGFSFSRLKPNYGLGVRYFYDKSSRLTVRLDYGWGEKRPGEKRQGGFYLSIAEAF